VTLTVCHDLTPADWIAHSSLPWDRLVTFGPVGFDAYARLRFLPDPVRPGQNENEADRGWRGDPFPALLDVLAAHTAAPDDWWFCVWEGFLDTGGNPDDDGARYLDDEDAVATVGDPHARPGVAPQPVDPSPRLPPKVVVPHRAYWLFRGFPADLGAWDTAEGWPREHSLDCPEPAFLWPADRAWCVACDVDPHWAGIGGSAALVASLTDDPRLDVVPADPTEGPPAYG
jgi:hypothetical protein